MWDVLSSTIPKLGHVRFGISKNHAGILGVCIRLAAWRYRVSTGTGRPGVSIL